MKRTLIWICFICGLLSACEGFWGRKTDTDFLDEPQYDDRTVAYVPIQPVMGGLSFPVDIIAGWDELIYVADSGSQDIISFDQAGNELGRFQLPGLTSIAQDRRLDLLASGTFDTIISGTALSLPALYRIRLRDGADYGLAHARIVHKNVHPFYFKSSTPTISDAMVRFQSISPIGDNRYYVARTGPSNAPNQFGGPDDAVLLFDEDDKYKSPVFITSSTGALFKDYFRQLRSISTLAKPPQSPQVNNSLDFLFASVAPENVLKVQLISFSADAGGAAYTVQNLLAGDTTKADRFLYEANRFDQPYGVSIAGDRTRYIFVVDASRDSLYQFNALGYEGINPPSGSQSPKTIIASFGGTGQSLTQFDEPRAVCYLNQILYVADAGNGRILRFKLTTDFD